jgi:hypothetical protein
MLVVPRAQLPLLRSGVARAAAFDAPYTMITPQPVKAEEWSAPPARAHTHTVCSCTCTAGFVSLAPAKTRSCGAARAAGMCCITECVLAVCGRCSDLSGPPILNSSNEASSPAPLSRAGKIRLQQRRRRQLASIAPPSVRSPPPPSPSSTPAQSLPPIQHPSPPPLPLLLQLPLPHAAAGSLPLSLKTLPPLPLTQTPSASFSTFDHPPLLPSPFSGRWRAALRSLRAPAAAVRRQRQCSCIGQWRMRRR